jgi:hypothetical protein
LLAACISGTTIDAIATAPPAITQPEGPREALDAEPPAGLADAIRQLRDH